MNWIALKNQDQVEELVAASFTVPKLIFKHSTRCIISKMALRNFEHEFNAEDLADVYFLDLISYRGLSDYIADTLEVTHESPQIILLKNGKVIHHDSHERISAQEIHKILKD